MDIFTQNKVYSINNVTLRCLQIIVKSYIFIDINKPNALPIDVPMEQIERYVEQGKVKTVNDPWSDHIHAPVSSNAKYIEKRDFNYERVRRLVTNPLYFKKEVRGKIVNCLVSEGLGAKSTLYRYACRYWQRGQHPNALLPDYALCGGKGTAKTRGETPLGRPSLRGTPPVQITDQIKAKMRTAIQCTLLSGKHHTDRAGKPTPIFSVRTAYIQFLRDNYATETAFNFDGSEPSQPAFSYFFYNQYSEEERARKRMGEKAFNARFRPLTSSVRANLVGPGQSFTIDSTPFDFGATDSERFPLARPTLYTVMDDFSSAYVGFLLVLTPASFHNAINCLTVAVSDKVEICKHFGLDLNAEDWPMQGLPNALFMDRGSEFTTADMEVLSKQHNISLKNSGAGQPEKRSVGERSFGRLKLILKDKLPGLISAKTTKKSGGKDDEKSYRLKLAEINREIAKYILVLNSKPNDKWDAPADFPSHLAKTPLNIWNWGVANKTGRLPLVDRDQFWFSAIRRESATLTNDVLKIEKVTYRCEHFSAVRTKRKTKNRKVEVIRDIDDASYIYLVPIDGGKEYLKCLLTEQDRRFEGIPWPDVKIRLDEEAIAHTRQVVINNKQEANAAVDTQRVVEHANQEYNEMVKGVTNKDLIANKGNKALQRRESSFIYTSIKPTATESVAEEIVEPDKEDDSLERNRFFSE
jgi:transposase InsO family protein